MGVAYKLGLKKRGPTKKNRKAMEDIKSDGLVTFKATLSAKKIYGDGRVHKYQDLGVISTKLVTDAFIEYLVDELQASAGGIAGFSYHGSGISSTAESATDTTLVSEIAVTRANGTQGEGLTPNIYNAMGTQFYDGSYAVREHGLFNAASGGTLMDRSVFAAINVADGDGIEFTYELTITGS
jgi:hypothetical protein